VFTTVQVSFGPSSAKTDITQVALALSLTR